MNDGTVAPDQLSIPLQKSLKRLRNESAISMKNLRSFASMSLIAIFLSYLVMHAKSEAMIALILVLLLIALGFWNAWLKISCARKLLALYRGEDVPALTLDSRGLTCPVIVMNYRAANRYLKAGENAARVNWEDIALFWDRNAPLSARNSRSAQARGMYLIKTKADDNAQKPKAILIEKDDFSKEEQASIISFTKRFLSIPITSM
jgi:hypothetical protein